MAAGTLNQVLPAAIEAYRRDGTRPAVTPLTSPVPFEPMEAARFFRTRAVMKIQDGCNFFCSFCEIPYARGRSRSREFSDVLREAERTVSLLRERREALITAAVTGRMDPATGIERIDRTTEEEAS